MTSSKRNEDDLKKREIGRQPQKIGRLPRKIEIEDDPKK
jgi:hypothetical protein